MNKNKIIFDDSGLRIFEEGVSFCNFVDLLRYRFNRHPEKIAINFLVDGCLDKQVGLSYEELKLRVVEVALHLKNNFDEKSRVLLLFPSGNDFIVAFVACLYSRMIAVPCVLPNRRERDWQKTYAIVDDCNASCVVTTNKYVDEYKNKFKSRKCKVIDVNSIYSNLEKPFVYPEIKEKDIAFLQYTSGSTGVPKGVIVSHRNLMHNQRVLQTGFKNSDLSIRIQDKQLLALIGRYLRTDIKDNN